MWKLFHIVHHFYNSFSLSRSWRPPHLYVGVAEVDTRTALKRREEGWGYACTQPVGHSIQLFIWYEAHASFPIVCRILEEAPRWNGNVRESKLMELRWRILDLNDVDTITIIAAVEPLHLNTTLSFTIQTLCSHTWFSLSHLLVYATHCNQHLLVCWTFSCTLLLPLLLQCIPWLLCLLQRNGGEHPRQPIVEPQQ